MFKALSFLEQAKNSFEVEVARYYLRSSMSGEEVSNDFHSYVSCLKSARTGWVKSTNANVIKCIQNAEDITILECQIARALLGTGSGREQAATGCRDKK